MAPELGPEAGKGKPRRSCTDCSRCSALTMALVVHELTKEWSFKEKDSEEWLPVARVPTNVHLDLLANKKYAPNDLFKYTSHIFGH